MSLATAVLLAAVMSVYAFKIQIIILMTTNVASPVLASSR